MQKITTAAGLRAAIEELEHKRVSELPLLKKGVMAAFENFTLINIVKGMLNKVMSAPDLKARIAGTAIGLTTGFLAKKAIIGKTNNPFKKLLGFMLEITVANKITGNAKAIRKVGAIVLNKLVPPGQ